MFDDILEKLIRRKNVPTFYGRVPPGQVSEDGFAESEFVNEDSYLSLRLASMHLKNRGELWRDFVPFSVVVADFLFDGEKTTFPFVVGNDLVQKVIEVSIDSKSIEPLNTTVAGPLPYLGGKVGVFCGLFRATANDMSRSLFDLVGDLAKVGDIAQLSSYLGVAEVLRGGVYKIFGMEDVEFCFGKRDELDPKSNARNRLKSGYLAFVNLPAEELDEGSLAVENSELRVRGGTGGFEPLTRHDYCLLALDHSQTRGHYADLPCEAIWKEIQRLIWEGQAEKAELFKFPELGQAVVGSADLTPTDQTDALALYKLKLEKEIERHSMATRGQGAGRATRGTRQPRRGSRDGGMGAVPMLQKAAFIAEKASRDKKSASLLQALASGNAKIPHLDFGESEGPVDIGDGLDEQINAMRQFRTTAPPRSESLLDALMADVMDRYG